MPSEFQPRSPREDGAPGETFPLLPFSSGPSNTRGRGTGRRVLVVERERRSTVTAGERIRWSWATGRSPRVGWGGRGWKDWILNFLCRGKDLPGRVKLLGQRAEGLEVQGSLVRGTKLWSALRKNSSGSRNKKMSALLLLTQKSGMKYFSSDFQQSFLEK